MDTFKAIQVFVCIADQGSLTKAADQLGYTRAMVSRYLEFLETQFSTRLFHRNTRKISLTTSGEKALLYCENILQQQQLLKDLSIKEQHAGTIRLTCGQFILEYGLAECIELFKEKHPHIQFDVLITEDTVDLIDSQIDLAFRITTKVADGLIARPILTVQSILCAHPHYLDKNNNISHPDQLLQHQCLVHQSMDDSWTLSTKNQQPQNYLIYKAIQSNDAHALYILCMRGLGIAMLPKAMVQDELKEKKLMQVLPKFNPPELTLSIVYSSRRHLPKKTQEFIAFIIDQLEIEG